MRLLYVHPLFSGLIYDGEYGIRPQPGEVYRELRLVGKGLYLNKHHHHHHHHTSTLSSEAVVRETKKRRCIHRQRLFPPPLSSETVALGKRRNLTILSGKSLIR